MKTSSRVSFFLKGCIGGLAFALVFGSTFARAAQSSNSENVTQPELIHIVTDNAPSLREIALFLYGDIGSFRKIARWNHLPSPYRIKIGQKLILRDSPTLNAEEGTRRLARLWRRHFGLPENSQAQEAVVLQSKKVEESFRKELEALKAQEEKENPEEVDSKELYEKGQEAFKEGKYEEALVDLRKSRNLDPDYLAPWMVEIKILKTLNRKEEAQGVARELVKRHEELKDISLVHWALEN